MDVRRVRFQLNGKTQARWEELNPILLKDEPGLEQDTNRLKFGDGVTPWNDLEYFTGFEGEFSTAELQAHIDSLNPHPVYDEGPSLLGKYRNAKV